MIFVGALLAIIPWAVRGNKANGSEAIINSELWISSFSSKIASSGVMSAQTDLLAAMMNITTERQIDAKVFHGWSSAVRSNRAPAPQTLRYLIASNRLLLGIIT